MVKKSGTLLQGRDCAANDSNPIDSGISNNPHLSENRSWLKPSAPPLDPNMPFMVDDNRGSAPPLESQDLESHPLKSQVPDRKPLDASDYRPQYA